MKTIEGCKVIGATIGGVAGLIGVEETRAAVRTLAESDDFWIELARMLPDAEALGEQAAERMAGRREGER